MGYNYVPNINRLGPKFNFSVKLLFLSENNLTNKQKQILILTKNKRDTEWSHRTSLGTNGL